MTPARVVPATVDDLPTILQLQLLAYQSEARLLGNPDIPPLKQTLDDLRAEHGKGVVLKAVDGDVIVGSVRGRREGGTTYVSKLMVHLDSQGHGIGSRLLEAIESALPAERFELFTSDQSLRNLELYERVGYRPVRTAEAAPGLRLVYMQRNAAPAA